MEWVETTGRTIEEAKDAALDRLGVDERDAEFDVVEEARSGLFGRVRQEARVRARVRPDQPRPRVDRRGDRRRRGTSTAAADGPSATPASHADAATLDEASKGAAPKRVSPASSAPSRRDGSRRTEGGRDESRRTEGRRTAEGEDTPGPTAEEIGEQARVFLDGLAEVFDLDADAEVELLDDVTVEARLVGDDLGLLIGPKAQTLAAVQDLTRAAVQHGPRRGPRLRVDVGGYQLRRRDALARFTRDIAAQVLETGAPVSMEPMPAVDRKVVHDTVNTVGGVVSRSEGDDPHRRVVIESDPSD